MIKELIIFDKDGTLIDFDAFWVNVSVAAVKKLLKKLKYENIPVEEFLVSFGVKNGVSDIDGVLCKGTYEEIGVAAYNILRKYGCQCESDKIVAQLTEAYKESADYGLIKPTCNGIKEVLTNLRASGKKLALVTTDNYEITNKCLNKLGIKDLFDKVFADDGKTPTKPDADFILEYFNSVGITSNKALMVGDTMTDITFARNAGMNIITVCSRPENQKRLLDYTDMVITDVSYICDAVKELESK